MLVHQVGNNGSGGGAAGQDGGGEVDYIEESVGGALVHLQLWII